MTRSSRSGAAARLSIVAVALGGLIGVVHVTRAQVPPPVKPPVVKPPAPLMPPKPPPTAVLTGTTTPTCYSGKRCYLLGENLPVGGSGYTLQGVANAGGAVVNVPASLWMSNVIKFSTPSTFTGSVTIGIYKGSALVSNQISIGVTAASTRDYGHDIDGDGVKSTTGGGADCDDLDGSRYPGNAEVCDPGGHDEDCLPNTVAARPSDIMEGFPIEADRDRDGLMSARCCNMDVVDGSTRVDLVMRCATDCDDNNYAIQLGSQICVAGDPKSVAVCAPPPLGDGLAAEPKHLATYAARPVPGTLAPPWDKRSCPAGSTCVTQPNGTGVCR